MPTKQASKLLTILLFLVLLPTAVLAVDASLPSFKNPFDDLEVKIPGMARFSEPTIVNQDGKVTLVNNWIAEYLAGLYSYLIAIIGVFAVVGIAIGGVIWVTSFGNPSMVGMGKEWVTSSLLGLLLALGSYTILNSINPDLVRMRPLILGSIDSEADPSGPGNIANPPSNIVTVRFDTVNGQRQAQVDQSIADSLKKVMAELKNIGFSVNDVGSFNPVSKKCHGRGLAIDINVYQNYCVDCWKQKGRRVGSYYRPMDGPGAKLSSSQGGYAGWADPASVTQKVVNIFKSNGWCWGGDWSSFKDYMHFSNGCNASECSESGKYDFGLTVKQNHENYKITYP